MSYLWEIPIIAVSISHKNRLISDYWPISKFCTSCCVQFFNKHPTKYFKILIILNMSKVLPKMLKVVLTFPKVTFVTLGSPKIRGYKIHGGHASDETRPSKFFC